MDGAMIDLGGILKGFAADGVGKMLIDNKYTSGYVSIGTSSLYILSVAVTMALTVFLGIESVKAAELSSDWRTLVIFAAVIAIPLLWKRLKKKEFSSVLLVAISGILGALLFGI